MHINELYDKFRTFTKLPTIILNQALSKTKNLQKLGSSTSHTLDCNRQVVAGSLIVGAIGVVFRGSNSRFGGCSAIQGRLAHPSPLKLCYLFFP
jgi:hypothetical protein